MAQALVLTCFNLPLCTPVNLPTSVHFKSEPAYWRGGMALVQVKEEVEAEAYLGETPACDVSEVELQAQANLFKHADVSVQTRALSFVEEALSQGPNNIETALRLGVIPDIVDFLQGATSKQQDSALKTIMLITAGTAQQTRTVVESGAIPILILHTRSQDPSLAQKALWCLGNIAGDNSHHHKLLKKYSVASAILRCIERECLGPEEIATAVWALANVCRNKSSIGLDVVQECIPILKRLLTGDDPSVLQDACFTFAYLSDGSRNNKDLLISSQICDLLSPLLRHKDVRVVYPALRTISNLVSGTDDQTQGVLDSGVVQYLTWVLEVYADKHIVKEACWALSSITSGPVQHVQAVIDERGFQALTRIAQQFSSDVRSEAVWAIANALTGGSPQQIREIVTPSILQLLCALLVSRDSQTISLGLESIWSILLSTKGSPDMESESSDGDFEDEDFWRYAKLVKQFQGLQRLANLRMHENDDISTKALDILALLVESPTAEFSDLEEDLSDDYPEDDDSADFS